MVNFPEEETIDDMISSIQTEQSEYYKGLIGYQVVGFQYVDGFPTLVMEICVKIITPKLFLSQFPKILKEMVKGFYL